MKEMGNLQKIPNYDTYLSELMNAVVKQDQKAINHIFNKIDTELKKIRLGKSVTFERNQIMWDDPKSHFRAIEREEVEDLKMEFEDNLELFQLASLVHFEPAMTIQFTKMIKNLSDIRQRTNRKTARSEIVWDDSKSHLRAIESEEIDDFKNEINDLISLYNIAQSENYTEGIALLSERLNEIAPNLANDLLSENSGMKF